MKVRCLREKSRLERSRVVDLLGKELSFKDLEDEHTWNRLAKSSRTTTPLWGFSAQKKKERKGEIKVFDAYKWWRSITKVLERLFLPWSCLESREYEDVLKILGRVLGVLGVGFRAERGREERVREMWGWWGLSRIDIS